MNLYHVTKTNGNGTYVQAKDAVDARIKALAGEPQGVKCRKTTLVKSN
jgi:hypothetical protein